MEVIILVVALGVGLVFYWINKSTKEVADTKAPEQVVKLGPEPVEEKTSTVAAQPVVEQPVIEQPVVEEATQPVEVSAPKKRTRKPAAMKVEKSLKKAVKKVK